MGTSNSNAKSKSKQIISYYIFQRKISEIINNGINPYFKKNKEIIDICVINPIWIRKWKENINYNKIKTEFDKINAKNEESLLNKLQEKSKDFIEKGIINDTMDNIPPSMDNNDFYNQFIELQIIKNEIFDFLVDYETYKLLFNVINPFNYFTANKISGIINDKMIILMLENLKKIKFLYKGEIEGNNSLIQLTMNFPSEKKYDCFYDEIKDNISNYVIQIFNSYNINYIPEVKVNDRKKELYYVLKNENLISKYIINKLKENSYKAINFSNVGKDIYIGLNNIPIPAYLNSVIQNLANIDILTRYFLNEFNFKIINNNSNICFFTCFYCEVLSKMCCDTSIEYYDLKDFNDILYLIDSKFKFDMNCIPGDLIKFILEKMNYELNYLFLNNNLNNEYNQNNTNENNNTIISNFFTCLKGTKVECQNCKKFNVNFNNSFILEFNLDVIYQYYKNKSFENNSMGKHSISLEQCFDHYTESFIIQSDDENICNFCHNKANTKYQNEFYFFPYILIISINKEINNNEYVFLFQENLNLHPYLNNLTPDINKEVLNYNYQLRGLITNTNNNDKKNYSAFCRNRISDKWYKYEDLDINYCQNQIKDILSKDAEILIYESIKNQNNEKDIKISTNFLSDSLNPNIEWNNNINKTKKMIFNSIFEINDDESDKDYIYNLEENVEENRKKKYTEEQLKLFESMRREMEEGDDEEINKDKKADQNNIENNKENQIKQGKQNKKFMNFKFPKK